MLAAYAASINPDDPLSALVVGDRPTPQVPDGWARVRLKAASLNHHDLWSLRGVGLPAERLPMILGCDGAGLDQDGNEVIVHAVITDPEWRGDDTLDPQRSLLSEKYQGTLAEEVVVPARNLVPKPAELSWEAAACLPTSYLTAYRMLFTRAELSPGDTILVQGAGGGVATALIALANAAGLRVWATSRDEAKRARALELGAEQAFESGARLPERVDAVMETVGAATWTHSLRSLRPGGAIIITGATSGFNPKATELQRIFFLQLKVIGSTMGSKDELLRLSRFVLRTGVRPEIQEVLTLAEARKGFERLLGGDIVGKVVITMGG